MGKIANLEDIENIFVHWSESNLINDELGCDDNCDIEKSVDPVLFDDIVKRAAKQVRGGYDKTSLSVKLKNGVEWCKESKFYLGRDDASLLNLLNK